MESIKHVSFVSTVTVVFLTFKTYSISWRITPTSPILQDLNALTDILEEREDFVVYVANTDLVVGVIVYVANVGLVLDAHLRNAGKEINYVEVLIVPYEFMSTKTYSSVKLPYISDVEDKHVHYAGLVVNKVGCGAECVFWALNYLQE